MCLKKSTNIQEKRKYSETNAQKMQICCGAARNVNTLLKISTKIGKSAVRRKTILSQETVLAKFYVKTLHASRRNREKLSKSKFYRSKMTFFGCNCTCQLISASLNFTFFIFKKKICNVIT